MTLYNRHEELGCYEGSDSYDESLRKHISSSNHYYRSIIEEASELCIPTEEYHRIRKAFYAKHKFIETFEQLEQLEAMLASAIEEIQGKVSLEKKRLRKLAEFACEYAESRGSDFIEHYKIKCEYNEIIFGKEVIWITERERVEGLYSEFIALPDPPKDTEKKRMEALKAEYAQYAKGKSLCKSFERWLKDKNKK